MAAAGLNVLIITLQSNDMAKGRPWQAKLPGKRL